MTIQEGNKLIAEFMGAKVGVGGTKKYPVYTNFKIFTHKTGWTAHIRDAMFHKSWDWLMPVVEKIELLDNGAGVRYQTSIDGRYLNVEGLPFAHPVTITRNQHAIIKQCDEVKITAVWKAVINFITWYNTNNPKTPPHAK